MKPFLVCNWKTYVVSTDDSVVLTNALEGSDDVTVVVCPSALHTASVCRAIGDKNILLGAQDISVSVNQPQTGNLSGVQLRDAGISYTLVGHAETRAVGITNRMVADKTVHTLVSGLIPIICLSEQKNNGNRKAGEEVSEQLEDIVGATGDMLMQKKGASYSAVVAYEPTAYIGAEDTLAPEMIKHILNLLRGVLQKYNLRNIPVIYGGSVNLGNVEGVVRIAGADGFLLGRAGVHADTTNMILHSL